MVYTAEKLSGNKVKLSFSVPAEIFDEAMQQAYLKTRGRINVPGFRKGKAPRKLIESMYGPSVFYDDAFDIVFPDVYKEAVEKEGLHPVDKPELDLQQIGPGQELKFTAEVFVVPDVTLGDYKALSAVRHLHPVPQEQIDQRIAEDLEKASTEMDVTDRSAQMGDIANIDYLGTVDGVPFEGGTDEGHHLEIGSKSFIPGFEEQVIGMNIGEEKDLKVIFPADYQTADLAGKEAVFHVRLNGMTVKMKPELDDEFAADVSSYTTFKEYQEAIVKELTQARDEHAETHLESSLIQQAVDQADCDIPQAMIEDEIDVQIRNMKLRMSYQGLRYEDYLKYTGMDEAQVRDMMKADASNNVKSQLVLDAIAKAEKLEPSEAEVESQIERHAKEMGREVAEYRPTLTERQLSYYKDLAASQKVVALLKENAVITLHEGDEHEDEALNAQEVLEQVADALPEEDDTAEAQETQETDSKAKGRAKKK